MQTLVSVLQLLLVPNLVHLKSDTIFHHRHVGHRDQRCVPFAEKHIPQALHCAFGIKRHLFLWLAIIWAPRNLHK